ncbi:helix-turn-helix domain-containing protein [Hyphomicrobium sp.]|uniref:AraC-like ligand-binding domain-containing protein n=1 Tax=Hyphomicrobium sp. TaxID=82 RepID=UPI0025C24C0D|nr:helix-turn-helix domain-containing protein [Hyphomicrobium sp.]MCC7251233.1 helix-turn-helix domain-containing protein [Hyphomicrobium sp.]
MIYSTEDVHPRERLSYWLEVATRGYVEHEFRAEDANTFSGTVEISALPGVSLATFDAAPAHVRRSERSAARADSGDVLIAMQQTGESLVSQDGHDSVLRGRGMFLVDPLRPFNIDLKTYCTSIVIRVPRTTLEARLGNFAGLTARPITAATGVSALAMGFLELLPDQAGRLDDVAGLKVAEQMLDLLALAFTESRGAALSSPRAVALLRLKGTVERLLIEPGLKPERVAAEAGISVRYANALLAEEHTSIERYIAERRLERCRGALDDVGHAHRSISEIAFKWGFSDLSHFGRRFKARYGLTPTEYKRRVGQRMAEQPLVRTDGAIEGLTHDTLVASEHA